VADDVAAGEEDKSVRDGIAPLQLGRGLSYREGCGEGKEVESSWAHIRVFPSRYLLAVLERVEVAGRKNMQEGRYPEERGNTSTEKKPSAFRAAKVERLVLGAGKYVFGHER